MDRRAFLLVIAIGALIGWALPSWRPASPIRHTATVVSPPARPAAHADPQLPETALARGPDGHFFVDAEVNGQMVHFVVDTGATLVALTTADAQRIGIPFDRAQFRAIGSGASGPISGERVNISSIRIDRFQQSDVPGVVIGDGMPVSLLGQSFLSHIPSIAIAGDRMTMR